MVSEKERYHTLDALRGVAAILVALYHFRVRAGGPNIAGYLAVDLFFVLSGFVIALNYQGRIRAGLTFSRFMVLRIIRLYPLYFAGWAIGIVGVIVARHTGQPGAVPAVKFALAAMCNLLMLPTPFQSLLFPLNGPSWSLFFEMLVNVLFAVSLARASSRVLIALGICAGLYLIATIGEADLFNVGWNWSNALGGLARTILSFSSGMLIYRHFHPKRHRTWLSVLPVLAMIAVITIGAFYASHATRELITVIVVFPIVVGLAARWDLPAVLQAPARILGDLSYAVYAVHWPLIAIMWPMIDHLGLGIVSHVVYIIGVLAVAFVPQSLV